MEDETEFASRGRPSKFRPEFVDQARKLCELGATDFELARFFDVHTDTINRWRVEYDDFCGAVIAGKAAADDRVERALYNRAVGYTFESEKVFQNNGQVVRAEILEHVPPDPGAAKNWLTNRRPDRWREKVTIGGDAENPLVVKSDVSDADRAVALMAFIAKTKAG